MEVKQRTNFDQRAYTEFHPVMHVHDLLHKVKGTTCMSISDHAVHAWLLCMHGVAQGLLCRHGHVNVCEDI